MAQDKEKKTANAAEAGEEELEPFDYKNATVAEVKENTGVFERSERDEKKANKREIPAEQAVPMKGQGERVLNFEMEEEFAPVLKIFGNGRELAFDIKDKITLGSDSTKAKIIVEHASISPLHCVFGVKDKEILIKHNATIPIIVRGKKLEAGKTYKLPYGVRIKLADLLFAEVTPTRPLGLEAVTLNRDWKLEFKDNNEDFIGSSENIAKKIEDELKRKGFFGKLFSAIFDPRDRQDLEEEYNEEVSDWVTEEEWRNAPDEEKKGKKILKEGEIIDKNFRAAEKIKIKKSIFIIRPFLNLFHNLKDEFSFFENQSKKDLKKQLDYSRKCLEMHKIKHLSQKNIISEEAAKKLAKVGMQSIVEVSNLPVKKISSVLKIKEKEALEIKENVTAAIKAGAVAKTDKNITALEKKLTANENKVASKMKHLQIAGPLKRIFGSIVTYAFIYSAYYLLINREEVRPFYEGLLADLKSLSLEIQKPEWTKFLSQIHEGLIFILFFLSLQLFFHLLFGTNLGQFILGLKNGRGILTSRVLGICRYVLGLILFPFLIFDLPMFFRYKTLKEVLTFNTLIRREARSIFGEILGVLITASSLFFATYLLITQRPWNNVPKEFELPLEAKKQLLALIPSSVNTQAYLAKIGIVVPQISDGIAKSTELLGKAMLLSGAGQYRKEATQSWRKISNKKAIDIHHGLEVKLEDKASMSIEMQGRPAWEMLGANELKVEQTGLGKKVIFNIIGPQFKYTNANNVISRLGAAILILNGDGIVAQDDLREFFILFSLKDVSYIDISNNNFNDSVDENKLNAIAKGENGRSIGAGCVIQGHALLDVLSHSVRISYEQFKSLSQLSVPEYGCQTTVDYEGKVDLKNKFIIAPPGGIIDLGKAQYIPPNRTGGLVKPHSIYSDPDLNKLILPNGGRLTEAPMWITMQGHYRISEKIVGASDLRKAFDELLKIQNELKDKNGKSQKTNSLEKSK
jgi:hypothetical protein